ncbi:MAG TPA: phenylalanine--tRNA ligase beta subunit-related protein [Thermoanaerobaculia bacterium]|nr:phenylalanine--tRNA ligase beta subunit-related protein [Thermoanaerobaculia bacterium]
MPARDLDFNVDSDVLALGVRGIYFVAADIGNRESDPEFEAMRDEVVAAVARTPLDPAADPILAGFRQLHERVHCSNRKFVSSPENLHSLVARTKTLPHVNLLVDVYNLVSLQTRLALGAHDVDRIDGDVHLRLTRGDERFVPLGSSEPKPVRAGEYGYVDDANDVICRLEVRQVEKTKVTTATKHCFFIVQGNAGTDAEYLASSAQKLIALLRQFCGGTIRMLYEWQ